jgi:hypothetical protein
MVLIDHSGGEFWQGFQHYITGHLLSRGLISREDLRLYLITDSVEKAVREVTTFYSNFHSVRYTRDELVIRLRRAPTPKQIAEIAEQYADIAVHGGFRVSEALPVEADETALHHLPRLVFAFNRRNHGRLRMLIDHLNTLP